MPIPFQVKKKLPLRRHRTPNRLTIHSKPTQFFPSEQYCAGLTVAQQSQPELREEINFGYVPNDYNLATHTEQEKVRRRLMKVRNTQNVSLSGGMTPLTHLLPVKVRFHEERDVVRP